MFDKINREFVCVVRSLACIPLPNIRQHDYRHDTVEYNSSVFHCVRQVGRFRDGNFAVQA